MDITQVIEVLDKLEVKYTIDSEDPTLTVHLPGGDILDGLSEEGPWEIVTLIRGFSDFIFTKEDLVNEILQRKYIP